MTLSDRTRATLCALALAACTAEPEARPATPSPAPAASAEQPPPAAPPRTYVLPVLADCTARDRSGAPVVPTDAGHARSATAYLEVKAGDGCKIVRGSDLVYRLHGPARAEARVHRLPSVLLREGVIEVDLAAGATTPDSGFWVSTPSARVELVQGARVVARAYAAGGTHLYVVSGQARVQPAGATEADVQLGAGQGLSVSSDGRASAVAARLARVEDALAWLAKQRSPAGARGAGLQALVAAAAATFAQVEAGQERLQAMSRSHEQHAAGSPEAMALQREIATESGKQLAARRRFDAQEEALRAWTLDPGEAGEVEVRALLDRVDQWHRRNAARSHAGPDGRGR
jgi:hypothetical protein